MMTMEHHPGTPPEQAKGYRALVVDDELPLAEVVASYLEREQFEAVVAANGVDAIAVAREMTANSAPVSAALTRQLLWRMAGAPSPLDAHHADSKAIFYRGQSGDVYEGVMSFLEKRPPRFTWS